MSLSAQASSLATDPKTDKDCTPRCWIFAMSSESTKNITASHSATLVLAVVAGFCIERARLAEGDRLVGPGIVPSRDGETREGLIEGFGSIHLTGLELAVAHESVRYQTLVVAKAAPGGAAHAAPGAGTRRAWIALQ